MKIVHRIQILIAVALLMLCCISASAQINLVANPVSLSFTQSGNTAPPFQNIVLSTNTGAQVAYTIDYTPKGNWLSVAPLSGTTNSTVQVFITQGLGSGTYNGTITITASGVANSPLTVPVTYTVATAGQLASTPTTLTFTTNVNGPIPASQSLSVTGALQTAIAFNASVEPGATWLSVSPGSGTSPATITASANPTGLAVGTYTGKILLAPTSNTGNLEVSVTFNVTGAPQITLSASSITYNYQLGTANPARQTITVSSSGSPLGFGISTSYTGGAFGWLVVTPSTGATPTDVNFDVNTTGLAAGVYVANVLITAPGGANSPLTIPVTLNASTNAFLNVSPTTLSFNVQQGAALPGAQQLTLAASNAASIPFAAAASTSTGGQWLQVTPTNGNTPATLSISLTPAAAALLPGTYNGTVAITTAGTGNPPQNIPVTLTVSNTPIITIDPAGALVFVYQTGKALPTNQVVQLGSTGSPISFTVGATTATGTGNWLSATQTSGTTAASVFVSVNPTGLAAGSYDGSVTLTPTGSNVGGPQQLPVKLIVSATPLMVVSPGSLSFTFTSGTSSALLNKSIALTSTDTGLAYSVTFASTNGPANLISVAPLVGTTPSNLSVTANATALNPGTYTGTITVTATNANTQIIPVTVVVTSNATLQLSPTTLTFTESQGGSPPIGQTVNVAAVPSGAPLAFTIAVTTNGGGGWLSAAANGSANGNTPGAVNVSINPNTLAQGTYTGTVTIVSNGASNSPQNVSVTLIVGNPQGIAVSAASKTFTFQTGGTTPANQTVDLTSTGGPVPFTATASTQSGGNWLSVSPGSGNTAATSSGTFVSTLTLSVNPTGLAIGTYNGAVTITSAGIGGSPLTVGVVLTVTSAPAPTITVVANAATFQATPAVPGLIISIGGKGMGPAVGVSATAAAGFYPKIVGQTRVLFDGIPAVMIYSSDVLVSAIVPYAVAGRFSTSVQVEYQGTASAPISLAVDIANPGVFGNPSGSAQGAIINQDNTLNGPGHPAPKNTIVSVYATGEGQVSPAGIDGQVIQTVNDLRKPVNPVRAVIGGVEAVVDYAGSAPLNVAGVMQVNVRIPATVASGNIQLVLIVGGRSSPVNATTVLVQ